MEKLKPCPFCGGQHLFQEGDKQGLVYGYAIDCINPKCDKAGELIIKYGFSNKFAKKKAIAAWNR